MTASAEGLPQSGGVEMRVHGVGDHGLFSALGKPVYTGTAADRVRIGSLPSIPKHELKLIHWSRPSRRITRTVTWYLAYPFTLINMAGFMGPERSENPAERRLWWFTRAAVVISSLMMTFAMAMWLSVILETGWRMLGGAPGGPAHSAVCGIGPGVLACLVVNRMLRGRPLVDQGNRRVALLTLVVLLGAAGVLAGRATVGDGVLYAGEAARDPMTLMVGVTTIVAWGFAVVLCGIAWWAQGRGKAYDALDRTSRDRTALAGAGMLIVFAVAILHTAGAGLRLLVQTVLTYAPPVIERRVQGAQGTVHVLPIDVIPALFTMMAAVFGVLFWREYQRRKPGCGDSAQPHGVREPVAGHVLLRDTDQFLGRVGLVGLAVSFGLWIATAVLLVVAATGRGDVDGLTTLFIAVEIAGLLLAVGIMVRGPDRTAARVRRLLGSLADVAGFWAPDLHPLAGASYRLAVLRGLRRGVREARTDEPAKPIALVGHSQGAVLCAWFIRGGHWQETRSENCSDEHALAMRMHDTPRDRSDRIALFTCGSPLGSLYRTFFPRYFNEEFFQAAARQSFGSVWHNYWRKTDPFSARLSRGAVVTGGDHPQVLDIDVTELEDEVPKGHYEYWQERRVRRDIEEYFASFKLFDACRQPAPDRGGVHRRLRGLKVALPRLHLHGN